MKKAVIYTLFGLKYDIIYESYSGNSNEHQFFGVKGSIGGFYEIDLKELIVPVMNSIIEFKPVN